MYETEREWSEEEEENSWESIQNGNSQEGGVNIVNQLYSSNCFLKKCTHYYIKNR